MKADAEQLCFTRDRFLSSVVIAALLGLVLLSCTGCAYFRTRPVSYQELEQRNKEAQEHREQFLDDGYYGTWTPGSS